MEAGEGKRRRRRPGGGRRASPERKGFVVHTTRPAHRRTNGVHVTMRALPALSGVVSLRSESIYRAIGRCFVRKTFRNTGARVVHYSVQSNHVHLILESDDALGISRAMQGLASAIARVVNARIGRRGRFWRDRYHRVDLTSARQARNALVYVLQNKRKHGGASTELDAFSSAPWFTGWAAGAEERLDRVCRAPPVKAFWDAPVRKPQTRLLSKAWALEGGLIDPDEVPKA